ncbi:malonic semialdehyde reductase [Amycolatopsis balhimycina]|uniref:malonic semialdehyde reductase n=1 Tax=Amycolatopsis balhimycina TaxID=208443 RepID=UPI00036CAB5B|nr:malonic semialdehyde reductase [Amycolatopsis balhimycina]
MRTVEGATLKLAGDAQDLLFREARSATEFTDDPVTDEQVAAIYDLVKYGPTSLNQQPLRMVLVRSPAARARLLPFLDARNRTRTEAAPLPIILAADVNFHEKLPVVFPHAAGLRDALHGDPRRRAEGARYNALLQIGYLIVGVRAAGLGAGPMIGYDPAGLDREFFPDGGLRSLLVMNIGVPRPKRHERLPRLSYDEVVTVL